MIIRDYVPKDFDEIQDLIEKHKIDIPPEGRMFVAVDERLNKVVGFIVLRPVIMIEPIVSDNPIAAIKLHDHVNTLCSLNGTKLLRAFAKDKVKRQLVKKGWHEAFQDYSIMEKIYY